MCTRSINNLIFHKTYMEKPSKPEWVKKILEIKNDKENPPCQDIQDADSNQTI